MQTLLHSGYQYDDSLALDLYGSVDDGEFEVKQVCVAGTKHDITTLFGLRKLRIFEFWLDVYGNPAAAQVAAQCRHGLAALPD